MVGPIGVLSGLGPLVGRDPMWSALRRAVHGHGARGDDDYPGIVLGHHDPLHFIDPADLDTALGSSLVNAVAQLELEHPSVVGVGSNTAHLIAGRLRDTTAATFIDLIDATAAAAARHRHRYLIVSSSPVRASGVYAAALHQRGVRFNELDDAQQRDTDAVTELVMAGRIDEAGARISAFVDGLRGLWLTGLIVACAELPLALSRSDVPGRISIVSSSDVLAGQLVDTYYALQGDGHANNRHQDKVGSDRG